MDYHHNFSDINAGMAIGMISACAGYFACYPALTDGVSRSAAGVGAPRIHVLFFSQDEAQASAQLERKDSYHLSNDDGTDS